MEGELKKGRIRELDFCRALAALGVITAHFSSANYNKFPLSEYNNLSLSSLSVCCFLIISGFAMFHRYDEISDYALYYKKQWLKIYPPFYLVWVVFSLKRLAKKGPFCIMGLIQRRVFFYL